MESELVQFEDGFEVGEKDPDGKKFDKVSRFQCRSDIYEMNLTIDINVDIYPLEVGDRFQLLLRNSLDVPDENNLNTEKTGTIMDEYDYVMHGKIFKYEDSQKDQGQLVELYASFGGLLMLLVGDQKPLENFNVDTHIYLLIRKSKD